MHLLHTFFISQILCQIFCVSKTTLRSENLVERFTGCSSLFIATRFFLTKRMLNKTSKGKRRRVKSQSTGNQSSASGVIQKALNFPKRFVIPCVKCCQSGKRVFSGAGGMGCLCLGYTKIPGIQKEIRCSPRAHIVYAKSRGIESHSYQLWEQWDLPKEQVLTLQPKVSFISEAFKGQQSGPLGEIFSAHFAFSIRQCAHKQVIMLSFQNEETEALRS